MAELPVDGDQLVVHMGRWEQLAALREDVRVPLGAVRLATLEPARRIALSFARRLGGLRRGSLAGAAACGEDL